MTGVWAAEVARIPVQGSGEEAAQGREKAELTQILLAKGWNVHT